MVINSPAHDTTILNKQDVEVSVSVQPDIGQYGHQIQYQLAERSIVSRSSSVTFKNVFRGTYNLSVSVVDTSGQVVSTVASRTFHMKRFFKRPAPPPPPKVP